MKLFDVKFYFQLHVLYRDFICNIISYNIFFTLYVYMFLLDYLSVIFWQIFVKIYQP